MRGSWPGGRFVLLAVNWSGRDPLWSAFSSQERAESPGPVLAAVATCPSRPRLRSEIVTPLGWSHRSSVYLSRYPSSKIADFDENEPDPPFTFHKLTPPAIDPPSTTGVRYVRALLRKWLVRSVLNLLRLQFVPFPAVSKVEMRSSRRLINRLVSVHLGWSIAT